MSELVVRTFQSASAMGVADIATPRRLGFAHSLEDDSEEGPEDDDTGGPNVTIWLVQEGAAGLLESAS